ncbi:hypothetical protein Ancab_000042 [Ancistrocladus abbreviatus]
MEASLKNDKNEDNQLNKEEKKKKPPFVVAKDDTKPVLQDPLWSSDPIQTEEAVLRLPPFPFMRSNPPPK